MQRFSMPWRSRTAGTSALPYDVTEGLLLVGLAAASVALFWSVVRPLGPVGHWQALGSRLAPADPGILTRFDPFFRSASTGTTAVTSLPLKLFGVRLDQAMGHGSAIIATPDGIQNSYGVGDEIVPGVKLKSVAFDSVTITRGATDEQLFLDQSVAASPTPVPGVQPQQSLANDIAFTPQMEKGAVTGFVVAPKGSGVAFATTGLQAGDVVTQINGTAIKSVDDAAAALGRASPPTFMITRAGKTMNVTAGTAK